LAGGATRRRKRWSRSRGELADATYYLFGGGAITIADTVIIWLICRTNFTLNAIPFTAIRADTRLSDGMENAGRIALGRSGDNGRRVIGSFVIRLGKILINSNVLGDIGEILILNGDADTGEFFGVGGICLIATGVERTKV
jgi:hypothetical protein